MILEIIFCVFICGTFVIEERFGGYNDLLIREEESDEVMDATRIMAEAVRSKEKSGVPYRISVRYDSTCAHA